MSVDWTRSMRQAFSFCEVDPVTWADARALEEVSSLVVTNDTEKETLESGTIEVDAAGWLCSERIVRAYLEAEQGGEAEHVCVATLSFQGERSESDVGRRRSSADGYGMLQDMAQDSPPFGWCCSGDPCDAVAQIVAMSCRAPFVGVSGLPELDAPVWAKDGDSWLSLANAVAARVGHKVSTDAWGRVRLVPTRPMASLGPSWTYGRESCIVAPHVVDETDLFGIPNWCEVTVSDGSSTVVGHAENSDHASPTSIVRRGHRIPIRITNPEGLAPGCTQAEADAFAARALSDASVVTRTWSYTHAWCPVSVGNAVMIDLDFGSPVVARVTSQDVTLKVGVEVAEVAVSTERTWEA